MGAMTPVLYDRGSFQFYLWLVCKITRTSAVESVTGRFSGLTSFLDPDQIFVCSKTMDDSAKGGASLLLALYRNSMRL